MPDSSLTVIPVIHDSLPKLFESGNLFVEFHKNMDNTYKEIMPGQESWFLGVLLLAFVLLTWSRFTGKKKFMLRFRAFFENRFGEQLLRDEKIFSNTPFVLLNAVFLLNFSALIYLLIPTFQIEVTYTGLSLFSLILAASFFLAILKLLLFRFFGWIFEQNDLSKAALLHLFLFFQFVGVALIPILLITLYFKGVSAYNGLQSGLILLLLAYTFYLIKMIILSSKYRNVSTVYIILYICTLEILPLSLVIKEVII